jgi:hypothetical protein
VFHNEVSHVEFEAGAFELQPFHLFRASGRRGRRRSDKLGRVMLGMLTTSISRRVVLTPKVATPAAAEERFAGPIMAKILLKSLD